MWPPDERPHAARFYEITWWLNESQVAPKWMDEHTAVVWNSIWQLEWDWITKEVEAHPERWGHY